MLISDSDSVNNMTTRANFLVIETLVDEPSRVAFCGVSHDKLCLIDNRWRFAERVCILDTEMLPNSLIYPL